MAKSIGVTFTIGAALGPGVSSAFSSIQNRIRATQQAFRVASRESEQLQKAALARQQRDAAVQRAKAQISTSGRIDTAMRQELQRLNQAYAEAARRAGVYGQSLEQINQRQRQLAQSAQATERQLRRLNQVQNARSLMQGERDNRRNMLGGAVSTAMSAVAMAAPLKIGMDFEASMSKVAAISGATGADFDKLRAQARQLGASTVWSAKEAADAMTFLSMAGFKVNDTYNAMPGMLSLASAGAMDLASTADIASNVLSGFGMGAEKMTYVADVMAKTFTNSNTSIRSIGESMKYCAPAAKAAGQSFQDVAAMIGKLGDAGIQGSMAGTALNAMMMRLASPPEMAATAMRQLGISVKDAQGNMRAMPDILRELEAKTKGMGDVAKVGYFRRIFGLENAKSALILSKQALSGELQKMSASLYEEGYATNVANKQVDNLAGDFKSLNSAAEEVAICLYDTVSPALRQITQGVIPIVRSVGEWISANPRLTQGLVLLGGAFVAFKAAGLAFTLVNSYRRSFAAGMTSLGGQVTAGLGTVQASMGRLRAELTRPINISAQGFNASVGGIRQKLDSLRISASRTLSSLRQITPASMAAGAAAAASGAMAATGRAGFNALRLGVRGVGMAFKTMFGPMSLLMMGLSYGVEQIIEHWDVIQPYFEALWEGVKAVFQAAWDFIKPIVETISSYFSTLFEGYSKVAGFIGKGWDMLFGNDKEKERKEREAKEAEAKRKAVGLDPATEAALKSPAQIREEEAWTRQYQNHDFEEVAKREKRQEKARKEAEKQTKKQGGKGRSLEQIQYEMDNLDLEEDEIPDDYLSGQTPARPTAKKRSGAGNQGVSAADAQPQIIQPQVQVSINVTQNGIPEQSFAEGVINAIKSRQSEFEQIISALVNEQARLAYGG